MNYQKFTITFNKTYRIVLIIWLHLLAITLNWDTTGSEADVFNDSVFINLFTISLLLNIIGIVFHNIPYQTIVFSTTLLAFITNLYSKVMGIGLRNTNLSIMRGLGTVFAIGISNILEIMRIESFLKEDESDIIILGLRRVTTNNIVRAVCMCVTLPLLILSAFPLSKMSHTSFSLAASIIALLCLLGDLLCFKFSKVFWYMLVASLNVFLICSTVLSILLYLMENFLGPALDTDRPLITAFVSFIPTLISFIFQIGVLRKRNRTSSCYHYNAVNLDEPGDSSSISLSPV